MIENVDLDFEDVLILRIELVILFWKEVHVSKSSKVGNRKKNKTNE